MLPLILTLVVAQPSGPEQRQAAIQRARARALEAHGRSLQGLVDARLARESARLAGLGTSLARLSPALWIERVGARLARAGSGLEAGGRLAAERAEHRLSALAGRLDAISPLAVLGRGYSVTRRAADGRALTDAGDVGAGDRIETRLARGSLSARVEAVHEDDR